MPQALARSVERIWWGWGSWKAYGQTKRRMCCLSLPSVSCFNFLSVKPHVSRQPQEPGRLHSAGSTSWLSKTEKFSPGLWRQLTGWEFIDSSRSTEEMTTSVWEPLCSQNSQHLDQCEHACWVCCSGSKLCLSSYRDFSPTADWVDQVHQALSFTCTWPRNGIDMCGNSLGSIPLGSFKYSRHDC